MLEKMLEKMLGTLLKTRVTGGKAFGARSGEVLDLLRIKGVRVGELRGQIVASFIVEEKKG